MNKKESIISAVISILLGILFLLLKGEVISIALTVLGVAALVSAVVDFANKMTYFAIVKAVVGVCILVFGWLFVNLALYILAAAFIMMGLLQIVNIHRFSPVNLTVREKIFLYLKPVVTVLAGGCLLFNQGGTIAWVFVVTGVLLIVEGVLELMAFLQKR